MTTWLKSGLLLTAITALAIWAVRNILAQDWDNVALAMMALLAMFFLIDRFAEAA